MTGHLHTSELSEYTGDCAPDIQRALSSWFPASTHPGGFAWEVATGQLPERIVVAKSSTGVTTGWATFSADDSRVECAPGDEATTTLLAAWLLDAAGESRASVAVHHGQRLLRAILADHGFAEESLPLAGVSHPAEDTSSRLPAGYRIRPMDDGEDALRVQAHRRAWKPSDLPFTDGSAGTIDEDVESRFNDAAFASMRHDGLYIRDLDLIIQAPDDSLAGCCTVWLDPSTGWAEIEPLGIVPEHRNRGLAQALALDACRRVARHGGHGVFINSAPLPYYRAPWDAYLKAGFTPMNRGTRMNRRR